MFKQHNIETAIDADMDTFERQARSMFVQRFRDVMGYRPELGEAMHVSKDRRAWFVGGLLFEASSTKRLLYVYQHKGTWDCVERPRDIATNPDVVWHTEREHYDTTIDRLQSQHGMPEPGPLPAPYPLAPEPGRHPHRFGGIVRRNNG